MIVSHDSISLCRLVRWSFLYGPKPSIVAMKLLHTLVSGLPGCSNSVSFLKRAFSDVPDLASLFGQTRMFWVAPC